MDGEAPAETARRELREELASHAERLPLLEAISMLRTGDIQDMKTATGLLLAGRTAAAPD